MPTIPNDSNWRTEMQLRNNSYVTDCLPQSRLSTRERAFLRRMFARHADGRLTAFFREHCITEEQEPQLLTETLSEAVKQFPWWITQVAFICHLTSHYRRDVHGY